MFDKVCLVAVCFLIHLSAFANTDGLFVRTFGSNQNKALIFIHGGPDHNSHDFEITTAPALEKKGYFVVVYDQRGQGRSDQVDELGYTYSKYADDIKDLIERFNLVSPTLIGHSHGGSIALEALRKYPLQIQKVALIAAPVNWLAMSNAIFKNCESKYTLTGNSEYLRSLRELSEKYSRFDHLTAEDKTGSVAWLFIHAGACGAYNVTSPSPHSVELMKFLNENPLTGVIPENSQKPMPGFLKNENYIRQNRIDFVGLHKEKICGVYGAEDGLFDASSLAELRGTLGEKRFRVLPNSSHGVYIQQQDQFIHALQEVCGI
jgi:proline iminopeptidase